MGETMPTASLHRVELSQACAATKQSYRWIPTTHTELLTSHRAPAGFCCPITPQTLTSPNWEGLAQPGALSLFCTVSILGDKGAPPRSSSSSPDAAQVEMMVIGSRGINTDRLHRPQRVAHSSKWHPALGRSPAWHRAKWLRNLVQVVFIFNMTALCQAECTAHWLHFYSSYHGC